MKEIPALESRRVRTQPRIVTAPSPGARAARMSRRLSSIFMSILGAGGKARLHGEQGAYRAGARALARRRHLRGKGRAARGAARADAAARGMAAGRGPAADGH